MSVYTWSYMCVHGYKWSYMGVDGHACANDDDDDDSVCGVLGRERGCWAYSQEFYLAPKNSSALI